MLALILISMATIFLFLWVLLFVFGIRTGNGPLMVLAVLMTAMCAYSLGNLMVAAWNGVV